MGVESRDLTIRTFCDYRWNPVGERLSSSRGLQILNSTLYICRVGTAHQLLRAPAARKVYNRPSHTKWFILQVVML